MLVSTFLYSLWYVGRVSVAALKICKSGGNVEFADSLPDMWDRQIYHSRSILVPNYIAFGHVLEPFVPTSQLYGCRDTTHAWYTLPPKDVSLFPI